MTLLRRTLLGATLWGWAPLLALAVVWTADGVADLASPELNSFPYAVYGRRLASASLVWMGVAGLVALGRSTGSPRTGGTAR